MKNKDVLSWKLKDILEREPLLGHFLEDMCRKVYHVKNSDLITVKELLEELIKDFEILGIEEDKRR